MRSSTSNELLLHDLDYSSIFCYIGILLRCPGLSRLLVNSHFQPSIISTPNTCFHSSSVNSNASNGVESQGDNIVSSSSAAAVPSLSLAIPTSSNSSLGSSSVTYDVLRPKIAVTDMVLWREGKITSIRIRSMSQHTCIASQGSSASVLTSQRILVVTRQ